MSFWNIFSSPKTVDTAVETAAKGIYNGLDKLKYTEEEKTQDQLQDIREHREYALKVLELTKDASPARRWIATQVLWAWKVVLINILAWFNVMILVRIAEVQGKLPETALSESLNASLKELMAWSGSYVVIPTGVVLGFYFVNKFKIGKAG